MMNDHPFPPSFGKKTEGESFSDLHTFDLLRSYAILHASSSESLLISSTGHSTEMRPHRGATAVGTSPSGTDAAPHDGLLPLVLVVVAAAAVPQEGGNAVHRPRHGVDE